MDNWKLFTSDSGVHSLENEKLEEQSYYRMKVFLQSYFKKRYQDQIRKKQSYLFHLVMNLQGMEVETPLDGKNLSDFYIDGHKMYFSWNELSGLVITSETREGNYIVRELAQEFRNHEIWI